MAKRPLLEAIATDNPDLWIKLASGERLPVHRAIVSWSSSVAKQLPPGDTWDVSGLVLDGRAAAERPVVAAWLAAVYPPAEGLCDEPGEPPQLADLLAFADAVGTSRPALLACCQRCPLTSLTLMAGEKAVALPLDGHASYYSSASEQLWGCRPDAASVVAASITQEQAASMSTQVAAQLESLLHLAYKLRLTDLQDQLHAFIHGAAVYSNGPLINRLLLESAVFTDRVMAAADPQQKKAAWIDSVVRVPCVIGGGEGALLVGVDDGAKQPVRFKAALGRPYMGAPTGTAVHCVVSVFKGAVFLTCDGGAHELPVPLKLLLG
ncbi:hypothetical protein MNEG_0950 [Monoraphidium neglectum]|uniref:BTB domain-containing protein n=1 Tax=Monoraphidium neglectum TaxID=145388 RepID=A0A0D2MWU3_9CHLO|nr:hypothetical protein MNEG_0950 [Monoraphidium neglectum]KIZ07005.1 hypothetical protein MNEG_0950 [Monoraphidium neglectum]|eukprot:XP_013906024.1 hypothetical protein MNEG_0950 [Monoraphidium neglectum]